MVFAKDVRGNTYVLNEKRYKLSKVVSDVSKIVNDLTNNKLLLEDKMCKMSTIKDITKLIQDVDVEIHQGAAVAIAYSILYFGKSMKEYALGRNLRAAFIYGGVARGLKEDKPPKDVDIMLITKEGAELPKLIVPKLMRPIEAYPEDFFTNNYLGQDTEQASFNRRILAMPILPLYGENYLKDRISAVLTRFKDYILLDMDNFIEHQMQKRLKEMRAEAKKKGNDFNEPDYTLFKLQVVNDLGMEQVINELGMQQQVVNMFLSSKFNQRKGKR